MGWEGGGGGGGGGGVSTLRNACKGRGGGGVSLQICFHSCFEPR